MMIHFNPSSLKRDPEFIKGIIKTSGDCAIALEDFSIQIPERYLDKRLATIGDDKQVLGIFPIICGDRYAVNLVCAMMPIDPTSYSRIEVNSDGYYEFKFAKGSVCFPSLSLLKQDTLIYQIFDELLSKGNIPWYLDYNTLASIFDTAPDHANANVGRDREITELLISLMARDTTNRAVYYRQVIDDSSNVRKKPPVFIAIKNVMFAPTNTLDKIAGSYMTTGLVSALVNPTDRVERIEKLLRS